MPNAGVGAPPPVPIILQPEGADAQTQLESTSMKANWKSALFFLVLFLVIFLLLFLLG